MASFLGQYPYKAMAYSPTSRTCKLWKEDGNWIKSDEYTIMSHYNPPHPPVCNCDRIYKSVGRENITVSEGPGYDQAGGLWFSHPKLGEC